MDIDGVFTQTFHIKKYSYNLVNHYLHKSITVTIYLLDMNGNAVHTISKVIEGEEYSAWGTDDRYLEGIIDKVAKEYLNKTHIGVKVSHCPPCEICESMCGGH